MPPKGKKVTARCQEPPSRCQEPPRQPERRQKIADRFTLVLPPELSNLPPRQAPASQSETTIQSLPPRQAPASQSGTNTQSLQPHQAPVSQSGTTTQSLQPRQAPASQSEATFQPPLPRQAPATLLSSQETIETVPSRLQSQQSAHLEMISSQESGAKLIITVTNARTFQQTYSKWRL